MAATLRHERLPPGHKHPLGTHPSKVRAPASKRREGLQDWLDGTLRPWFEGRILPVTAPIAERWGVLSGECRLQGKQVKIADGLIVATALRHDLTIVTRNTKDFVGLGVTVLNPWHDS